MTKISKLSSFNTASGPLGTKSSSSAVTMGSKTSSGSTKSDSLSSNVGSEITAISEGKFTSISEPNTVPDILLESGLDPRQAEILSYVQFLPALQGDDLTDAGQLLDLQKFLRSLTVEDVGQAFRLIEQDPKANATVGEMFDEIERLKAAIDARLKNYSLVLRNLNDVKQVLDLKDNADLQAEVGRIRASRGSLTSRGGQTVTLTTPPLGTHSSLEDILVCHLGFSRDAYKTFSNTKIFAQILTDLKITLTEHSPHLLSTFSQARQEDRDPLRLHTIPERNSDFSFKPTDLAAEILDQAASSQTFSSSRFTDFNSFLDSLPVDEVSRVKLLTAVLSRELRMSAGIARMTGTALDTVYKVTQPGLIDRVVGQLASSAIGVPASAQSMAYVVRFEEPGGQVVLPFERRLVVNPGFSSDYKSGTSYLVDTILTAPVIPESGPLDQFSHDLKVCIDQGASAVGFLLNFDDTDEVLHANTVIETIYRIFSDRIMDLGGDQQDTTSDYFNKSCSLSFALLTQAQMDPQLKHLLFRYVRELRSGNLNTFTVQGALDDRSGDGGIATGDDTPNDNKGAGFDFTSLEETLDGKLGGLGSQEPSTQSIFADKGINGMGADPRIKTSATSTSSNTTREANDQLASSLGLVSLPREIETRLTYLLRREGQGRLTSAKVNSSTSQSTTSDKTLTGSTVKFVEGEIESVLNEGLTDSKTIFSGLVNLVDLLTSQGESLSAVGPSGIASAKTMKTTSGLTKMTRYSDDTLLLMVFEIVCSLVSEFVSANFNQFIYTGSAFTLSINSNQNYSVVARMKELVGETSPYVVLNSYSTVCALLNSIHSSLLQEDSLARDLVDVSHAIKDICARTMDSVSTFFKFDSTQSATANAMKTLFGDSSAVPLLRHLSDTQMALSWRTYQEILSSTRGAVISQADAFTATRLNALDAMLRDPKFEHEKGQNLQIIAVGLPVGTLESLQNPPFSVGYDETLESPTADLITISVYRRDPQYPDLIFRPMKFTFDVSRFVDRNVDLSNLSRFEDVLNSVKLVDIVGEIGPGISEAQEAMRSSVEYAGLTSLQKQALFRNHVEDDLLKLYVRLMTGVDMTEHKFVSDLGVAPASTGKDLDLLKNLQDRLPSSSTQSKVLLKTSLFTADIAALKVEKPKLFERIFLLALDPDDFLIDVSASQETDYGSKSLTILNANGGLFDSSDVTKNTGLSGQVVIKQTPREQSISFNELFVVVELGATS